MENNYEVYALVDVSKPVSLEYKTSVGTLTFSHEPFYVGKGKGIRRRLHVQKVVRGARDANPFKQNKIKKLIENGFYPEDIVLLCGLKEDDAYELEREIISIVGRRDIGEGPLTNLDDGGPSGGRLSDSSRARMSSSAKARLQNESDDDRKTRLGNQAESMRKVWATLSDEDRARLISKRNAGWREFWDSCGEEERKRVRAASEFGRKRAEVQCPWCPAHGYPSSMGKHFDKCKSYGKGDGRWPHLMEDAEEWGRRNEEFVRSNTVNECPNCGHTSTRPCALSRHINNCNRKLSARTKP